MYNVTPLHMDVHTIWIHRRLFPCRVICAKGMGLLRQGEDNTGETEVKYCRINMEVLYEAVSVESERSSSSPHTHRVISLSAVG